MSHPAPTPPWRRLFSFAMAFFIVNGLLVAPAWVASGEARGPWVAIEALVVVGVLALVPCGGPIRWVRGVTSVAVLLVGVLGFGDALARMSLGRPVNVYLDTQLLRSVSHLLVGTLGPLASVVVLLGVLAVGALVPLALLNLPYPAPLRRPRLLSGAGIAGSVAVLLGVATERLPGTGRPLGAPAVTLVADQSRRLGSMLQERGRLAEEAAAFPESYVDRPGLLGLARGTDVILAFVESYGVSALEDGRYAPVLMPRLQELAERMDAAGIHLVSGTLTAPVQGGQSWLAHGSVLSGLRLDNQLRYELFLAEGRETLIDDFRHAGHRTIGVMPAITMPWPEGERFGYDDIFVQRNMGYAGPPLNWVTMPDQYTWSFLEQRLRGKDTSVFAVVGLISSHAPWTPILPVLEDWDQIGDGSVFFAWENAGESPADLWRDPDRVREHYALSVDYALNAMTGFAERLVNERTLLIVLGDHQPAPLITGEGASRAVPVHVLSRDPDLLEPFLAWGFQEGALPPPAGGAPPMDAFRPWFVEAFGDSTARPPGGPR